MKNPGGLACLLMACLLLPIAKAGSGLPSFDEWQRLKAEGFEEIRADPLGSVGLPHNSVGAISNELKSGPVIQALARGLSMDSVGPETIQVLGFEDADSARGMVRAEIWWKLPGATETQARKVKDRLERYVRLRWAGHTARFALESLLAPARARTAPRSPHESVLWANPEIPPGWLRAVTNQPTTVPVPAERLARPGIAARPGEIVELKVTNYWFKVVDGPVTWHYVSRGNGTCYTDLKTDAQEDDPDKAEVFRQTRAEVTAWMKDKGIQGLGSVHAYWGEMRRILKERHGIDWKSPSELSPFVVID